MEGFAGQEVVASTGIILTRQASPASRAPPAMRLFINMARLDLQNKRLCKLGALRGLEDASISEGSTSLSLNLWSRSEAERHIVPGHTPEAGTRHGPGTSQVAESWQSLHRAQKLHRAKYCQTTCH